MSRRQNKVQPIEKFPLHPRADGRWQKRINNRLHYFTGATRAEARAQYELVKADLYAGRQPRPEGIPAPTEILLKLANAFLAEKESDKNAGRIGEGWYRDYLAAIRRFLAFKPSGGLRFSRVRAVELRPDDLTGYARHLHSLLGVHAYNRERECVVAMFNGIYELGWIDKPIRFRKQFPRRSAGESRSTKNHWLLSAETIGRLFKFAGPQFRAMILLGLNGGFGPGDCAALAKANIDLKAGRVRFNRPKNNIPRDFILWPETSAAIADAMQLRPGDDLVFRTAQANPWSATSIAHEFRKLAAASAADIPIGVGLNACRHTCATYANEVQDHDAWKRIMGRKIASGIDETYVDAIFLPRLRKISSHVRNRLKIGKIVLAAKRSRRTPAVA